MRKCLCLWIALLILSSFATKAFAQIGPVYSHASLAYWSKDIVVARLTQTGRYGYSATVLQTLYGSLKPGEVIHDLGPSLGGQYVPLHTGTRAVLFLGSATREYKLHTWNYNKAPHFVLPSGVHMIDQYGHVHSYAPEMSPGPYVAWGYTMFKNYAPPAKALDLKLPTLAQEERDIAKALRIVQPVRVLLSRHPTRNDTPELLHLVDLTSNNAQDCQLRRAAAITEQAQEQLRLLNDPMLTLEGHVLQGDANSFFTAIDSWPDHPWRLRKVRTAARRRVRFLIHTLTRRKNSADIRIAALEILLNHSAWGHPYSITGIHYVPIDNPGMADYADWIRSVAWGIFEDRKEDPNLRGLSLQLLTNQPGIFKHARRVYAHTHSRVLRFWIETTFLRQSDALYGTLHSSSGVAASIVYPVSQPACCPIDPHGRLFADQYRFESGKEASKAEDGYSYYVMQNLGTGKQYRISSNNFGSSSGSDGSGWDEFTLKGLNSIPAGRYRLVLEYGTIEKPFTRGSGPLLRILKTPHGNQLALMNPHATVPVSWSY
jgi:hypothetical protein